MKYRKLGNSEHELSEIGLGTWAIGGGDWGMGWGAQSKQDSIETILEALELGVNWIDTAHAYGFGEAEEVIAEALSQWQDKVFLATKCGVLPKHDRVPERFISPETIREEIEGSLCRLRVEIIDLYQIHWPSPIENLEESWQTLLELRSEGKVANIGVCNCYMDELKILGDPNSIISNQPLYNMLERKIESDVIPWCNEHNVGILAYSPMHSGLLTGKVSKEWFSSLPENDWRKHKVDHPVVSPLQTEDGMEKFIVFQSELQRISKDNGRSVGELAVAWVLRKREVTSAIVGARKKGQISQICGVSQSPLKQDEEDLINQAINKYRS
tara:strand:+ start:723 stop:1703 length:981 start_codon:yes stop_codon:yes gene_type:complete